MSLNVVVAGLPKSVQGAPDPEDGIWLTPAQEARIRAAAPDVHLEHIGVSRLNAGLSPDRAPHAILVETSGSKSSLDTELGILTRAGLEQLISPELKLIQSASAGAEHLVGLVPDGVVLANASGVAARAIAENVIGCLLLETKMLDRRLANQAARAWVELPARELDGTTMVVLGTGHIGASVARIAQSMGIRVIGVNTRGTAVPEFDATVPTDRLREVLRGCDHLVIAAPLTPATRGIIDAEAIAAMPRGAWLANVSRGAVHAADALVAALRSGHLRGAFVDCHAVEPLPADDPLWDAPGAVVFPHDSHASQLMGDRQLDIFVDNLTRLVEGRPFRNVVDHARGY